jgi:hypothetical protein
MSQENTAATETSIAAKESGKKRLKKAKAYPKKLANGTKPGDPEFEFIGRVESINVKGTGINSNQFLFNLADKKGAHNSYLLDPSEPLRFSAMASLLNAAAVLGAKVKVRSVPNAGSPSYASELEVRTKS